MSQEKIFSASIGELHSMLSFIREGARTVGFSSSTLNQIELASEEAIVNVIEHAYLNRSGTMKIRVQGKEQKSLVIEIYDQGPPFNPLEALEPKNLTDSIEEREVGGLGIYFIRKSLDHVSYRREGAWNVLVLTKNFN